MNRVVLNFLIVEGYKEGAKKFVKEANIDLNDPSNRDLKIDLAPRTHAPVCSRTPIHERMEGPGYACLHVSSEERIRII